MRDGTRRRSAPSGRCLRREPPPARQRCRRARRHPIEVLRRAIIRPRHPRDAQRHPQRQDDCEATTERTSNASHHGLSPNSLRARRAGDSAGAITELSSGTLPPTLLGRPKHGNGRFPQHEEFCCEFACFLHCLQTAAVHRAANATGVSGCKSVLRPKLRDADRTAAACLSVPRLTRPQHRAAPHDAARICVSMSACPRSPSAFRCAQLV